MNARGIASTNLNFNPQSRNLPLRNRFLHTLMIPINKMYGQDEREEFRIASTYGIHVFKAAFINEYIEKRRKKKEVNHD